MWRFIAPAATAAAFLFAPQASAALLELRDADIGTGDSVVVHTGDTALLVEPVYVDSGAVLVIEPGVIVKARELDPEQQPPAALIVARHGRIRAEGTAEQPIIFTAEADPLDPASSAIDFEDDFGLWGGIAVLGNATVNLDGGNGTYSALGRDEPRLTYGGTNDNDFSGVLRYVSIRFAGANPLDPRREENVDQPDDKRQAAGLALCGVGSTTVVDHIDVYNAADDGIRWYGGTVNCTHLSSTFCMDNNLDFDEGYRGHIQYVVVMNRQERNRESSTCMMHTGGADDVMAHPYTVPVLANVTLVNDVTWSFITYMRNGAGKYYNSIFYQGGAAMAKPVSHSRIDSGDIDLRGNMFGRTFTPTTVLEWRDLVLEPLLAHVEPNNTLGDPDFVSFGNPNIKYPNGRLDLRPRSDSTVGYPYTHWLMDSTDGSAGVDTSFLKQECFMGAFDPTQPMWVMGWTAVDFYGWMMRDEPAPRDSIPSCEEPQVQAAARAAAHVGDHIGMMLSGGALIVRHALAAGTPLSIELFDLAGRRHAVVHRVADGLGTGDTRVNLTALPAGTYVCTVRAGRERFHRQFTHAPSMR